MKAVNEGHLNVTEALANATSITVEKLQRHDSGISMLLGNPKNSSRILPNINAKNDSGWTVLMLAAFKGRMEIVEYLVKNWNPDLNLVNRRGRLGFNVSYP